MKLSQVVVVSALALAVLGAGVVINASSSDPLAFTTEQEMKVAIGSHLHDPMGTYNIIMRAYQQGLAPEATVIYHKLILRRPTDSYLKSAYAFSHYWATGNYSRKYLTRVRQDSDLVQQLQTQRAEAEQCRLEAVDTLPDSPVVLLETAVPQFEYYAGGPVGYPGTEENPRQALEWIRKAQRLAPDWSASDFYLGDFLVAKYGPDIKKRAAESLAYLQKAEKIDPEWHTKALGRYAYDYATLGDLDKAAAYADAYIKANPGDSTLPNMQRYADSLHRGAEILRQRRAAAALAH